MGKLHRGEDAELQGPVNILRGNDLEVLNAQAGILPGIFLQQAFSKAFSVLRTAPSPMAWYAI